MPWHPGDTVVSLWHIHFPEPLLLSSSPLLLFHLLLPLSSELWKGPWLKPRLVHPLWWQVQTTYWGGKSNVFTQVLRLLPHAGNLIWRLISPILALLGWAHMSCRLSERKYSTTATLQRLEKRLLDIPSLFWMYCLSVSLSRNILRCWLSLTEQTGFICMSGFNASTSKVFQVVEVLRRIQNTDNFGSQRVNVRSKKRQRRRGES